MAPGGLAPLAPLPQRPTVEHLGGPSALSLLSKPRLPSTLPSTIAASAATPQHQVSQGVSTAAAEDAANVSHALTPVILPNDAREPATIAGLTSPAAAPRDSPASPELSTPPGQPPLETHIETAALAQNHNTQKQSTSVKHIEPPPPPPLETPKSVPTPDAPVPTLPGAVPTTPTADARPRTQAQKQQARNTAAYTQEARVGKREPPKEPPPQAAVEHMSVTTDCRTVEQYIPFCFVELRNRLLSDFPDVFRDPAVAKKFVELCKWISLRNTLRLEIDYGDAQEKYAPLDPDKDTLAFKVAAAEEVGATATTATELTASKSLVPKHDLKSMVEDLYGEMDRILDKAEFTSMPHEDLENAKNHKSLMGLEVIPASDEFLEYKLHYRGTRTKKIAFRRWGLFKRQIEMNVYERLAICFRLKKAVCKDDVPAEAADSNSLGIDTRPWYKRLFCGRRASVAPALLELRDEFVYMKLFKDVLQSDVDMLLPGAVIKFTWFDYMMVWVPILVGCGMAVWKAINGDIDFTNLMNAALSVVLIVMPLTWGIRAYFSIKEKQRVHQAHLNALFLLHNLNNNAGVISQLLGEAQEQEDNETMLAYFFLWKGEAAPKPVPKLDLDRAVEAYVQSKLDELGVAVRMDYEVLDAISKLERLGLVQVVAGGPGADSSTRQLKALPLDLALEKAHVRNFDESREAGQLDVPPSEAKRQGAISLAWHECMDIFGPTGQKFRYFWNAQTGESQYNEPDEPYIKLGASAALDFDNAYGVNLADPNTQPPQLHHAKTA